MAYIFEQRKWNIRMHDKNHKEPEHTICIADLMSNLIVNLPEMLIMHITSSLMPIATHSILFVVEYIILGIVVESVW